MSDALDAAGCARAILDAVDRGRRVVSLLGPLPDGSEDAARPAGRAVLVETGVGELAWSGSLGSADHDREGRNLARAVLEGERAPGLHDGFHVELHGPSPELVVVGAGHIAMPLCRVGALLGFRVSVLDDRPEFARSERFPDATRVIEVDFQDPFADLTVHAATHVVLVTRGHRYDYECLLRLLRLDVELAYIGLIGSRRRVRATFEALLREGVERERLERVRAPLGLDLGAETPAEIAMAVGAELVLLRRGGDGRPLTERERVLERFFPPGASSRATALDTEGES